MTNHHPAYLNLKEFWSGNITLSELIARNEKIAGKVKVVSVSKAPVVQVAEKVFGVEASCPADKNDPDNGEWNY